MPPDGPQASASARPYPTPTGRLPGMLGIVDHPGDRETSYVPVVLACRETAGGDDVRMPPDGIGPLPEGKRADDEGMVTSHTHTHTTSTAQQDPAGAVSECNCAGRRCAVFDANVAALAAGDVDDLGAALSWMQLGWLCKRVAT